MKNEHLQTAIQFLLSPPVRDQLHDEFWPSLFGKALSCLEPSKDILDSITSVPGEISTEECCLLYNFFSELWTGQHSVLEIGPLFGKSSRCIALGMKDNPKRVEGRRLHTYDLFGAYYEKDRFLTEIASLFESGELDDQYRQEVLSGPVRPDFLTLFNNIHGNSSYADLVVPHRMALPNVKAQLQQMPIELFQPPAGEIFEAVFVDGCKSWYGTKQFMKTMSEHTAPGTVYFFQDFGWHTCFWLPTFFSLFSEYFEMLGFRRTTFVYRLKNKLPAEVIEQNFPDSPEEVGEDRFDQLFNKIQREFGEYNSIREMIHLQLQRAGALTYIGKAARGRAILHSIADSPYLTKSLTTRLESAMRQISYRPVDDISVFESEPISVY